MLPEPGSCPGTLTTSVDTSSSPLPLKSWRATLTHPHLPELASPQPLHQFQRLPGNLPLVLPPWLLGLLGLARATQPRAQPVWSICEDKGEGRVSIWQALGAPNGPHLSKSINRLFSFLKEADLVQPKNPSQITTRTY